MNHQHNPRGLQPGPGASISIALLEHGLDHELGLQGGDIGHLAGDAGPEGTEEVAGGGADGGGEESGAVLLTAGFVVYDELLHVEQEVDRVDTGRVEEEEVPDQILVLGDVGGPMVQVLG